MSLIVDLGNSDSWRNNELPTWLDEAWIRNNNARLICQLKNADDYSYLRALVPTSECLLAYPRFDSLETIPTDADMAAIHSTFLACLGAQGYLSVAPGVDVPPPSKEFNARESSIKNTGKPSLALVSPMPPSRSGVANYCVEILPALSETYEITLVVENPSELDESLKGKYAAINHDEMLREGSSFDRVMYHFGNSAFHYNYFTLLRAHPGFVILHDVFLGDCIFSNYLEAGDSDLRQAIYASHGWAALQCSKGSPLLATGLYPSSGSLFSDSYGLLVHNRSARDLMALYFDYDLVSQIQICPLARAMKELPDKASAKRALGYSEENLLYATFGHVNRNKCILDIIEAWSETSLAQMENARLLIVGSCGDDSLQDKIDTAIANLPLPKQVQITGFIDNHEYDLHLGATDIALQLRRNSRGESSAALLDCMGAALPTIINTHGSMAEVPQDCVISIADEFSSPELAQAIESAATDLAGARILGERARAFVAAEHSPGNTSTHYALAIERAYETSAKRKTDELLSSVLENKLTQVGANDIADCCDAINDIMSSTGALSPQLSGRQLLVDISAVVQHDLKSGIQRVVRNILRELLSSERDGLRVEPIYYDFESECFRYARGFTQHFLELPPLYLADDRVDARPGDSYLGLDLYYIIAEREISRKWLQQWRARGVQICHVVYDLLPVHFPDCFPPDQIPLYKGWLTAISDVSDGILCISRAVADEYSQWVDSQGRSAADRPNVGYFHLGAEMESSAATDDQSEVDLPAGINSPYVLMVGTIEPRKGHNQVLDAFERLWKEGIDLSLVVVGTMGWVDAELSSRIEQLSNKNSQFHYLNFVSDTTLQALYRNSASTIMASRGEGFGLPLIEAAYYGAKLIARDIPVFREVCGDGAWYFSATQGEELGNELFKWYQLYTKDELPDSSVLQWIDWTQSTAQLMKGLEQQEWYKPNAGK
jgi:glycosyltransferase involved in cell wall biosynthesis